MWHSFFNSDIIFKEETFFIVFYLADSVLLYSVFYLTDPVLLYSPFCLNV